MSWHTNEVFWCGPEGNGEASEYSVSILIKIKQSHTLEASLSHRNLRLFDGVDGRAEVLLDEGRQRFVVAPALVHLELSASSVLNESISALSFCSVIWTKRNMSRI